MLDLEPRNISGAEQPQPRLHWTIFNHADHRCYGGLFANQAEAAITRRDMIEARAQDWGGQKNSEKQRRHIS